MRKLTFIFIILASVFVNPTFAILDGAGTAEDPYLIQSLSDFDQFASDPNYSAEDLYTKLTVDVDLTGRTYTKAVIARPFEGIFDGNSHIISNITIDSGDTENDYLALFGMIGRYNFYNIEINAEVKNLGVINVTVNGGEGSDHLGGLCGKNYGSINNCYSIGTVTGVLILGGLCGNNRGSINNSYAICDVIGNKIGQYPGPDGSEYLGGLCGYNSIFGTIDNSYAICNVTGSNECKWVGGLCGASKGSINNCHSNSSVVIGSDSYLTGGLCGENLENASISNCYASGEISAGTNSRFIGGLCGANENSSISNTNASNVINCGENSYY